MSFVKNMEKKLDQLRTINHLYDITMEMPFWYEDVCQLVSPAFLGSLKKRGIIQETGVTRDSFTCIDEYSNLYRKVTVKQWAFCGELEENKGYQSFINDINFKLCCQRNAFKNDILRAQRGLAQCEKAGMAFEELKRY